MQFDLLSSAQSAHALHLFHQHSPLVHCMTNDAVQTFTANTLLRSVHRQRWLSKPKRPVSLRLLPVRC